MLFMYPPRYLLYHMFTHSMTKSFCIFKKKKTHTKQYLSTFSGIVMKHYPYGSNKRRRNDTATREMTEQLER